MAFDLSPSAAATFWKRGVRIAQSEHSSSKAKKKKQTKNLSVGRKKTKTKKITPASGTHTVQVWNATLWLFDPANSVAGSRTWTSKTRKHKLLRHELRQVKSTIQFSWKTTGAQVAVRIKTWGWREIPHLWKETKEERIVGMRLKWTSLLLITNVAEIQNTEMKTTTKNWQTSLSPITFSNQPISRLWVAVLVTILEEGFLIFCLYFCMIWYIYTCRTLV